MVSHASQSDPKVKIETITPERAAQLLEANTNNFRSLSESRAQALADVMSRGHFKFNGESIIIRDDGTIADGQTRLRASVLSGKPFKSVVVHGDVEDESNIDTGSKRTAAQLLKSYGVDTATNVASAIKAYVALFETQLTSHLSYAAPMASSEVFAWYKKHKDIVDSVEMAKGSPKGLFVALVAAVHYAGRQISKKHSDWWIKSIVKGDNLSEGDPVLRLRARFVRPGKRAMVSRIEQAALLIKSWNLSHEGASVDSLTWRGAGRNPEAFPVLGAKGEEAYEVPMASVNRMIGMITPRRGRPRKNVPVNSN